MLLRALYRHTRHGLRVCVPGMQLALHPLRAFLFVTKEAGVWAVLLAEAYCHFRIRNVIDLMCSCAEGQRIHDSWHVAGDTLTRLRVARVVCMCFDFCLVQKLVVTTGTHFVRLVFEA